MRNARGCLGAAFALVLLAPGAARAGGMDYPDNGTEALGRGGAFVAKADSGEAIYYNPAGLSRLSGLRLTLDSNFAFHNVTFQRHAPGGAGFVDDPAGGRDPAPPGTPIGDPVKNSAGAYIAPFGALSYGFAEGPMKGFAVAIGGYGPPAVGRYKFNEPKGAASTRGDAGLLEEDPTSTDPGAANRYQLVENDILIIYPTVAASYQIVDWLSVGVSLQYVYSSVSFEQVGWNYPNGQLRAIDQSRRCPEIQRDPENPPCAYPNDQVYENTYWDAPAKVDVKGDPGVTGILGVLAGPFHGLSLGASFRPPVPIHGSGTLEIDRTQMMEDFQVVVDGNTTEMELTLAPVLRVGARYDLTELLGRTADVELDYVWEGWSVVDEIVVTPDISTTATNPASGAEIVMDVPAIHIQKDWEDVHALRFGAEVAVIDPVAVRAGYIYETNAIPEQTASIDFANFGDRHVLTAGLGVRPIRAVEINVAYAHVFQPDLVVDESTLKQTVTDPGTNPNVVGNGAYETSYDILTAGVTLRFNQF